MCNIKEGYKESEVGVIPVEWDVVKLDKLGKIITGSTPKTSNQDFYLNGTRLWASPSDLGKAKEVKTTNTKLSKLGFEEIRVLDKRSILITCIGSTIGKMGIAYEEMSSNQQINAITCNKTNNPDFYYYVLFNIKDKIQKLAGTQAVPLLNKTDFSQIKVIQPPLKEQEKIADILSTADEKIDAITLQIQKAETLKKGLQKKLFIEGVGHTKFKDTGLSIVYPMRRIPEAWELKKLSDITTKITDGAHFTPTYVEDGIPFLRVTDLKSKDLLSSAIKYIPEDEHIELVKRCKPEYGDILYSKNGTIGLTRIITWDWEFSIFVSLCLIKPKRSSIIPEYLKYYLTSDIVHTQIKIRSKQGTVTNLHLEEIRDFFITVPPLEEQQQIANILLAADEKLEVLRAKKEKYETLKKGLLQKLLSGEVRV